MLNHRSIATQGIGPGLGARAVAVQGFAGVVVGPYPTHIAAGNSGGDAGTVSVAHRRRPKRRRREEDELVLLGWLAH